MSDTEHAVNKDVRHFVGCDTRYNIILALFFIIKDYFLFMGDLYIHMNAMSTTNQSQFRTISYE